MVTFKKGTNTKTGQELIACIEEKAVFMATVDGKIYKQFPRQHLKEEQFSEEVLFPGDYGQARKEYCISQDKKQEIDAEARRIQAEESRNRWYEERKQEVLTVRKIRNLAFQASVVSVYFVCARDMEYSSSDYSWEFVDTTYADKTSRYFLGKDEAKEYFDKLKGITPEDKSPIEVVFYRAEIDSEDILRVVDYEEMKALWEEAPYDYDIDYCVCWPKWESIEGAVYVEWEWDRYVGYARKFRCLRLGWKGETEEVLITGNEDRLFRLNRTLVLKAEEMEGLDEEEIRVLLTDELLLDSWKWRNPRLVEFAIENW